MLLGSGHGPVDACRTVTGRMSSAVRRGFRLGPSRALSATESEVPIGRDR